jgi:2-hydroxychromene-2-carboxylate isomerase
VDSAVALFYENFWVQWNDPTKPQNLHAIIRTIVGSDEEAKKVIERTKTDEVKKTLSNNTNKAFEDGAFGLPWFVGEFPPPPRRSSTCERTLTVCCSYEYER